MCKCAEGYGGALCDNKNDSANACSAFKCHHGQCHISDQGEPYCLCQPGFSGEHCQQGGSTVPVGGRKWGSELDFISRSPQFQFWLCHLKAA